jgi:hypothetical protein
MMIMMPIGKSLIVIAAMEVAVPIMMLSAIMVATVKAEVMASATTATSAVTGESARCCKRTSGEHESRNRRSEDEFVRHISFSLVCLRRTSPALRRTLRECFNWAL